MVVVYKHYNAPLRNSDCHVVSKIVTKGVWVGTSSSPRRDRNRAVYLLSNLFECLLYTLVIIFVSLARQIPIATVCVKV